MARKIVFFLLFIIPFAITPFGISTETPKVVMGELGIILLLIASLFSQSMKISLNKRQLFLYLGILVVTMIDALFLKTSISLQGNAFRMQGVISVWFLLLFSYLSANASFKKVPWFLYAVLLAVELTAMVFLSVDENHRYVGTLGEPNATGAYALLLWPFSYFAVKKFGTREKVGMLIVLGMVGIILALTNSRSAIIAFGIQIVFIFLKRINVSTVKTAVVCVLLYFTSYILPFFDHTPFENRVQIWQSALAANNQNLLFGHGFGNLEKALHMSAQRIGLMVQYTYVDSAHNIFLDWWVAGGIIGVLLLVSIVYLSFVKFMREHNERELVLFLGTITVLSFNPASIAGLLAFWWLMGQGMKVK